MNGRWITSASVYSRPMYPNRRSGFAGSPRTSLMVTSWGGRFLNPTTCPSMSLSLSQNALPFNANAITVSAMNVARQQFGSGLAMMRSGRTSTPSRI